MKRIEFNQLTLMKVKLVLNILAGIFSPIRYLYLMTTCISADPRIRRIPFVTGKPTFEELKRIHYELSMVKLQGKVSRPFGRYF